MADKGKYELLLEFDFVVDTDLAIYKYIRTNFGTSDLVDQKFIRLNNEKLIIQKLISRQHINPLEIIIPDVDTTDLYFQLLNENYADVLKFATVYDTFKLCITWLNNVRTPIKITILCKNKLEQDFIRKCNPRLSTIVVANKPNINMSIYTSLYVKYAISLLEYRGLVGKHLYIAAAGFNAEEDGTRINATIPYIFDSADEVHSMDLYTKVKYMYVESPLDTEEES